MFPFVLSSIAILGTIAAMSPEAFAATEYLSSSHQQTDTQWLPVDGTLVPEAVTTNATVYFNVVSSDSSTTDFNQEAVAIDVIDAAGEPFSIYPYADKIAWYDLSNTYQYTDTLSTPMALMYSPSDEAVGNQASYGSYVIPTSWHAVGETGYTTDSTEPGSGSNNVTFNSSQW